MGSIKANIPNEVEPTERAINGPVQQSVAPKAARTDVITVFIIFVFSELIDYLNICSNTIICKGHFPHRFLYVVT